MLALDIMLMALAQTAVSAPAQGASPAPLPNVEVVGPAQPRRRMICRTLTPSNSRIPAGRICRTQEETEAAIDRAQAEAGVDVRSTDRRTNEMLQNSGFGNWYRAHFPGRVSETSVGQTSRGQ
jgi:hypothetical protein